MPWPQVRRTRHEMYKFIDADYYGFRDEEDGVLAQVEPSAEQAMREEVSHWAFFVPLRVLP